jgi:hypothetical protein
LETAGYWKICAIFQKFTVQFSVTIKRLAILVQRSPSTFPKIFFSVAQSRDYTSEVRSLRFACETLAKFTTGVSSSVIGKETENEWKSDWDYAHNWMAFDLRRPVHARSLTPIETL